MTHYQPIPAENWREAHLMTPLSPLVRLGPIDDLELALAESWLGVSQATHRFLSLLREFDLRQGYRSYGCNDCAEWMDFKLKISRKTALHLIAEDGSLTAQLPVDELAPVQLALEQLVEQLPEDPNRDYFAARADALVLMARRVLDADQEDDTPAASPRQILVHVEASALDGQGGEADYPLPSIKRLCCAGEVVPILKDGDQVLNVGRKQRIVPNKLKQALAARDRDCQFPGCHHTQFLDAHHIKHWCEGGETRLENLILLCTHHHKLLHEGGFRLQPRAGKFYFARPDGRPVESPSSAEDGVAEALLE